MTDRLNLVLNALRQSYSFKETRAVNWLNDPAVRTTTSNGNRIVQCSISFGYGLYIETSNRMSEFIAFFPMSKFFFFLHICSVLFFIQCESVFSSRVSGLSEAMDGRAQSGIWRSVAFLHLSTHVACYLVLPIHAHSAFSQTLAVGRSEKIVRRYETNLIDLIVHPCQFRLIPFQTQSSISIASCHCWSQSMHGGRFIWPSFFISSAIGTTVSSTCSVCTLESYCNGIPIWATDH